MVALSHLQGFPDLALFDEPGSQRLKSVEKRAIYVLSCHQRVPMQKHAMNGSQQIPTVSRIADIEALLDSLRRAFSETGQVLVRNLLAEAIERQRHVHDHRCPVPRC